MKIIFLFVFVFILSSCSYKNMDLVEDTNGYPPEVAEILVKKCANAGCHNNQSKEASGGISLETWNSMFEGSRSGAVTIPYRPDFSILMYFVNVDSSKGIALTPTMPYNSPPLSTSEYDVLKKWIENGAPDKNGRIKFSDFPSGQKMYVANQAADVITILDVQSNLATRYIDVGINDTIESPHMVKCSPDGNFWYVIFFANAILQKFNSADNSLVASLPIGTGPWNSMTISSDSKTAFITSGSGKIVKVNLENMSLQQTWTGFVNPQGTILNEAEDMLYVCPSNGNFIYKISLINPADFDSLSLDPGVQPSSMPSLDPNQILFSPDYSKYFVSCQRSDEVRVFQTAGDSLLAIIPLSEFPAEMKMSVSKNLLFVACMSEPNTGNSILGRVDIIDMNSLSVIKSIATGHQPHGLAVSEVYNRVYVANRNVSHGGPSPHHNSPFGRNGYLTAIDLTTLELIPGFKSEVSVDPYSIDISH